MRGKFAIILALMIGLALGIAGYLQIKQYEKSMEQSMAPQEQVDQGKALAAQP